MPACFFSQAFDGFAFLPSGLQEIEGDVADGGDGKRIVVLSDS